MNAQPPVSVVLCNYNYARFVSEAIESVLGQTHEDFEVIIVDDGSTDNSREVIARYSDPRIRNALQRENRGQAAAFNAGFSEARGTFVAFLDSDDMWMPDKLATVLSAFDREDLSVVQHNLEVIDSYSRLAGRTHPGISPGVRDVLEAYLAENRTGFFSSTSGITCRRAVLKRIFPLPESWRICADVPLTRALPFFGLVCTLEKPLGYYRIHGSNSWTETERQQQWAVNEQRYNDCANEWFAKCGYSQRLDLTQAAQYKRRELEQLPRYHPRRFLPPLRLAIASVLPEPVKVPLRALRRRLARRPVAHESCSRSDITYDGNDGHE